MKQIIVVKVIVRCGDELLFLASRDRSGDYKTYELPGEVVKIGEDPMEVLCSKVLSDLGLKNITFDLFKVCSKTAPGDSGDQYISILFSGNVKDKSFLKVSSRQDIRWVKMSRLQRDAAIELTLSELTRDDAAKKELVTARTIKDTESSTGNKKVIINTDGGSRGNPGPSASGFVIKSELGDVIYSGGEYLGISTNNRAEYYAVELALKKALEIGAESVRLYLDSELVAKQLNGIYKVRDEELLLVYNNIKRLISLLIAVDIVHVRREHNKDADLMVNNILDAQK